MLKICSLKSRILKYILFHHSCFTLNFSSSDHSKIRIIALRFRRQEMKCLLWANSMITCLEYPITSVTNTQITNTQSLNSQGFQRIHKSYPWFQPVCSRSTCLDLLLCWLKFNLLMNEKKSKI